MDFDNLLSTWWQPAAPEREFTGQISRTSDGATTIELAGTLSGGPFAIQDPEPDVLFGVAKKGPLFTARRVMRSGAGLGMPGFPTEILRPRSLIVGAHVDESTHYDEAVLLATFVSDWLQESGIRVQVQPRTDAEAGTVTVSYKWPEVRTSQIEPGVSVSTWTAHYGEPRRAGYAITEDVALKVGLTVAVPIEQLIEDYVMPLVDLVSFATRRSNAIERVTVRTPSVTREIAGKSERVDLEFLTEWIVKPGSLAERLFAHHMNFAAGDASMGFDELLRGWFKLHRTLRASLAPYFGLLYAPPTYVNLRLVSISQTLEAYHRTRMGSRRAMSKEEFAALKKVLLDACPPVHRAFLQKKLGYLNQLSQVERTTQLLDRVQVPLRRLLPTRPKFAEEFIAARDAEAHPEGTQGKVDGVLLYDLTATATYVFEANIMLDLGFEEARCAELFERQPAYQHLVAHPVDT